MTTDPMDLFAGHGGDRKTLSPDLEWLRQQKHEITLSSTGFAVHVVLENGDRVGAFDPDFEKVASKVRDFAERGR